MKFLLDRKMVYIFGMMLVFCALTSVSSCRKTEDDEQYSLLHNVIEDYIRLEKPAKAEDSGTEAAHVLVNEGKLIQPSDTAFEYYALTNGDSRLALQLRRGNRHMSATVEIDADDTPPQRVELEKNGTHTLDLSDWAGKYVRLRFEATLNKTREKVQSDDVVEWEQISIQSPHASPVAQEQQSGDTDKSVLEQFQNYDVVYLLLDAFHAEHSNVYGYPKETTPFLASLAEESVVFENMFANAPYTLASTAVLFTSRYARENGLISANDALSRVTPTIAELLSAVDVDTYLVTRHGYLRGDWGLSRGFAVRNDENYGVNFNASRKVLEDIYETDSPKRKFVYIHVGPPHDPYNAPKKYRTFVKEHRPDVPVLTTEYLRKIEHKEIEIDEELLEYIIAMYDSNVLFADQIAELVYTTLNDLGVLENTIFVVTSDHGEAFLQHGKFLHGTSVFDEMLHVPFLIRFPEKTNIAPKRVADITGLIDVSPTLADLYRLEERPEYSGTSLLPLILQKQASHRPFIYAEALVGQDSKTIRTLEYKYILDGKQQQLYRLASDPLEKTNLYEQLPITTQYYHQGMRMFLDKHPLVSSNISVDMGQQNEDVIQNLKDLGYIQ